MLTAIIFIASVFTVIKIISEAKNGERVHSFDLKYIVLYDNENEHLIDVLEKDFNKRLDIFDNFINQRSYGRMTSKSSLLFMHIKELNGEKLHYDRPIEKWIRDFYQKFDPNHYDVLVFNPIIEMDWCQDALSQGYNYQGKIFFCLEESLNPTKIIENERAVLLMIHKTFHGFGYNHQGDVYRQYTFLDWDIGVPSYPRRILDLPFDWHFFDKHTHKVLGLIEKDGFNKKCLDLRKNQFVCDSIGVFYCKNSWGPFCYDINQNGVVDNKDDFLFNSPNETYLCDWNEIKIRTEDARIGPIKIMFKENKDAHLVFESKNVSIKKIIKTPMSIIWGHIRFPETNSIEEQGNKTKLNPQKRMWRLEIIYSYKNEEYYRPYYVHFPSFQADFFYEANFFYEREWYYFNRFGCDIPLTVDFADLNTYDPEATGLPSKTLFKWAERIDEHYDWDGDGVPDIYDTLPTVPGSCSNDYVRGVPDSSGDGFCDPGIFDFTLKKHLEPYEIAVSFLNHPYVDLCPYVFGPHQGCPEKYVPNLQ